MSIGGPGSSMLTCIAGQFTVGTAGAADSGALTAPWGTPIVTPTSPSAPPQVPAMSDIDFQALERKIEELVRLCEQLAHENQALMGRHSDWATERAQLIEKNELAKSRVEAMISRLKSLEQDG